MDNDTKRLCGNCFWFDQELCRRLPPRMIDQVDLYEKDSEFNTWNASYADDYTSWPVVEEKAWCGEWRSKEDGWPVGK